MSGNLVVPKEYEDEDWRSPRGTVFLELFKKELKSITDVSSINANFKMFREPAVIFLHNQAINTWKLEAVIAYMAVAHLDRYFVSKKQIPIVMKHVPENIKLFLVSLITVSWRYRNSEGNSAGYGYLANLAKQKDMGYSPNDIVNMELKVTKVLGWNEEMMTITPFSFLPFFVSVLSEDDLRFTMSSISKIFLQMQQVVTFSKYRPSLLAASALLVFSKTWYPDEYQNYLKELIASEVMSPWMPEINHLVQILELLQKENDETTIQEIVAIEEAGLERTHCDGEQLMTSAEASNLPAGNEPGAVERTHRDGKQSMTSAEASNLPAGNEPGAVEEAGLERTHRDGKQGMTSAEEDKIRDVGWDSKDLAKFI